MFPMDCFLTVLAVESSDGEEGVGEANCVSIDSDLSVEVGVDWAESPDWP